jgi:hypothetical protein
VIVPAPATDGFWFKADREQKDLETAEYAMTITSRIL